MLSLFLSSFNTKEDTISYSIEIVEQDGMRYMIVSKSYANDGIRIVNLSKDKAETEYYKR